MFTCLCGTNLELFCLWKRIVYVLDHLLRVTCINVSTLLINWSIAFISSHVSFTKACATNSHPIFTRQDFLKSTRTEATGIMILIFQRGNLKFLCFQNLPMYESYKKLMIQCRTSFIALVVHFSQFNASFISSFVVWKKRVINCLLMCYLNLYLFTLWRDGLITHLILIIFNVT